MLPPRSISVISVKAPTRLNTRHLYQLDATDNLSPGIIPLAVDHKIDHKYLKLRQIPLLNMGHNTVQIQRNTVKGRLQPTDITESSIPKLTTSPGQLRVQPQQETCIIAMLATQVSFSANIPQQAKDWLSSLIEGQYNSIISKSSMD